MTFHLRPLQPQPLRMLLLATGCTLALGLDVAVADGTYDGKWEGQANGSQATSASMANACVATATATIENNVVKGTLAFPRTTVPFGGTIASDGGFKTPTGFITGKFEGGSFRGSFSIPNGYCNPYRMTMKHS